MKFFVGLMRVRLMTMHFVNDFGSVVGEGTSSINVCMTFRVFDSRFILGLLYVLRLVFMYFLHYGPYRAKTYFLFYFPDKIFR